jgi:SAM-dependent methyltransferase
MSDSKTPGSQSGYYETYWNENPEWMPDVAVNHPDEQVLFGRYLSPGKVLLDYGCGNGRRYGTEMARRGVEYHGFDVSDTALKQAKELGLRVGRLGEDGSVDLPEGSVDVAICFEVLEHLMEPERSLTAIKRALKAGGIALISVPNAGHFINRIEFFLSGYMNPGGSPLTARKAPWNDPHIRFFNPALFRRLAAATGFEVVSELGEVFSFNALPWFYRQQGLQGFLKVLSVPFAWLGRVFPSVFSPRLFLILRRPLREC